jgi:rubrerythrin
MALSEWLRSTALRFIDTARQEDLHTLIIILRETYLDTIKDVTYFSHHAEHMYYPQFRQRLQEIAAEEQGHIHWLRETIRALGGELPTPTAAAKHGKNNWENLRLDLEEEKKDYDELLQGLLKAEHLDPAIAEELRHIRGEERRHREELRELLMKSEPGAPPHPITQRPGLEKLKQTWLERQKMEWLEAQRLAWEADGKPVPWIEWLTQQELTWAVNELPSRELLWIQRLAEQETL